MRRGGFSWNWKRSRNVPAKAEPYRNRMEQTVAHGNAFVRRFSILALLLDTWEAFERDNLSILSAALAFYALLALFPLLLLMIALGPLFVPEENVLRGLSGVVRDYLPGASGQVQLVL